MGAVNILFEHHMFKIIPNPFMTIAAAWLFLPAGLAEDNVQQVISIQNRVTSDLTWWNPARKTKPQNFKVGGAGALTDPTGGGGPATCDFCGWQTLTAEDTFGRVEGPFAVSASNLFKYGAPYQGVILFKHHDPLTFNLPQFSDLLTVADGWFNRAASTELEKLPRGSKSVQELYPLLVWNCLNRAGASQFHGHAQVMLSAVPFPAMQREKDAIAQYRATYGGTADYYTDLLDAHASAGLARRLVIPASPSSSLFWEEPVIGSSEDTSAAAPAAPSATAHASLCPTKDAEIVIHGDSLTCPAFQALFYCAMRALIDGLGVQSFNAGIHNIPLQSLRNNENSGNSTIDQRHGEDNYINNSKKGSKERCPVVARVVSRGKLTSAASDFGGLEVFAGASIGHTDPWMVIDALERAMRAANVQNGVGPAA